MKKMFIQGYVDDGSGAVPTGATVVDGQGNLMSAPAITNSSIGSYRLQAFNSDDGNWFILDGRALSRIDYSVLFARIGTTFGAGDGVTTFNIPPSPAGRAIGCAGAGAGLTERAIGDVVGTEAHTLSTPEMPSHSHTVQGYARGDYDINDAFSNFSGLDTGLGAYGTSSTGGGQAHNNMQPTAFLGYLALCVK